jgi:phage shock protein E
MAQKKSQKRRKSNKRDRWLLYVSIGLVLLTGAAIIWVNNGASTLKHHVISAEEAYQKQEEGAFILDVRTPEEWQEEHIPGATLIPLEQLPDYADQLPTDQEIVVYCHTGNRSVQALKYLLNAGFENVSSISGGINAWIARGYEVEAGS